MRFLLLPTLLAALLAAACVEQQQPVETQDIVSSIPWTEDEEAEYVLLDRDDGGELGRGTLGIVREGDNFELSQNFRNGDDLDESRVLVDATTLKPISGHRERVIDGDEQQIEAVYDPVEKVVTITEIEEEERRPIPHRLKDNYYDNDSSLFLWRTIPFSEGYEAAYRTVVTGSGEQLLVHLAVKGKEQVTVPAGTFDAWRLEVRAGGRTQIAWFADTPERPLVQYDNSLFIFQLTSLGGDAGP